jgi:hypothetical protein
LAQSLPKQIFNWSVARAFVNDKRLTCPRTGFIHALGVPPDTESAREAILRVNLGIESEEFQ